MNGLNIGIEQINEQQPDVVPPANEPTNLVIMLKKAVCDESTAEYQYIIAGHMARGAGYCDVTPEYAQHADEERDHKFKLLKRLEQLGFMFSLDLINLSNGGNPWTPITTNNIPQQLDILIKAEADAQEFYKQIIAEARKVNDDITVQLIKGLLADECEHETDLRRIREQFE